MWMFELPVTATGGDKHPARLFQGFEYLPDLHANALDSSHRTGAAGQLGHALRQQGHGLIMRAEFA